MRFDEHFIKQVLPDVSIICGTVPRESFFVVDSRVVKPGSVFIALQGNNCDGHDFVFDAVKRGATGVIIARDRKDIITQIPQEYKKNLCVIMVPNPLRALIDLAAAWRAQFHYPVVAITGSVGKTSTKELLAHVLDMQGVEHLASYGNQNTQIGVSLNVLRMRIHHRVAIFEVGVNKRGEMVDIMRIMQPTTGIITNVGHSHMEGLGSLQDIALEKRELFHFFTHESIGVVNGDLPVLSNVAYTHPVIKFGSKTTNQIQARKVRVAGSHISFVLRIYKDKYSITIKQPHAGIVFNSLAVTAVAHLLGIPNEIIVKAIQTPCVIAGRFEQRPLKLGRGIMIHDCYNANPESMKAALLAFQQIETKAVKVAVLGDMLELGINSPFWHRQVGRFLRKVPSLKHVVLVGNMVQWTLKTMPVGIETTVVDSWQKAIPLLEKMLKQESVVLVKGSQGMGLTHVVDKFTGASKITEQTV